MLGILKKIKIIFIIYTRAIMLIIIDIEISTLLFLLNKVFLMSISAPNNYVVWSNQYFEFVNVFSVHIQNGVVISLPEMVFFFFAFVASIIIARTLTFATIFTFWRFSSKLKAIVHYGFVLQNLQLTLSYSF